MMNPVEMAAGMHAALDDRAEARRFLTRFAAEWRAPLGVGDGYEPAVLDETEERLGMRLPTALRDLHVLDESWLTARGQNPEALDSVRVVMAGNWINA